MLRDNKHFSLILLAWFGVIFVSPPCTDTLCALRLPPLLDSTEEQHPVWIASVLRVVLRVPAQSRVLSPE